MANAAILIDNLALDGIVTSSGEETTMPASNVLTPHPSERWRSAGVPASITLDKGDSDLADTFIVHGLTCGANSTVRMRLSLADSSGSAGEVADETFVDGDGNFSSTYGCAALLLAAPAAWRYARLDIDDPDASFVEAGLVTVGLRESFTFNFAPGGSIQYIDRSRITETSAGLMLTWAQNTKRSVDLNFEWVSPEQRYGVIETMDRVNGKHLNVLLILDTDSDDLSRDSIVGLITDISPNTYSAAIDLFGKQFRLEERI